MIQRLRLMTLVSVIFLSSFNNVLAAEDNSTAEVYREANNQSDSNSNDAGDAKRDDTVQIETIKYPSTISDVSKISEFEQQSFNEGKTVKIPITKADANAFSGIQNNLVQYNSNLRVYVVDKGTSYQLIIDGPDATAVKEMKDKVMFLLGLPSNLPNCLINMSAMLKQYTEQETLNYGLSILPSAGVTANGSTEVNISSGNSTTVTNSLTTTYNTWNVASLYNNNSLGKVLVGTNAMTPNGVSCTLSSSDVEPVVVASGGSNSISTQTIQTSVQVLPTIIYFDRNNIEESIVRLDIQIQLSVITSVSTTTGVAYTQKNLNTSRIIKANGKPVVAGTFVNDQLTPSTSYVPILGQIPILNFFFSSKQNQIERELALLFLTVSIVPEEQ